MKKGVLLFRLLSTGFLLVLFQASLCISGIPQAFADREVVALFRDGSGNPITTALDLRITLWDAYDVRASDVSGDGSINTSAVHYGAYQTTRTITPDEQGYFIPSTFGYYRFSLESLPSFPQLSPFNSFLQLEYKAQGAANTSYLIYDFIDDPPYQNVTRMLLDEHSVYYVNDAGPRTNWNTFTLDANNNAPTAVTLQFGETLTKTLKYVIATTQFELNDDLSISGGLTISSLFTANGSVVLGDNGDTVAINSSGWDISTSGAVSGLTGVVSSGTVDFSAASNFLPAQASSDPGSCSEGQVFYNTTSNVLKVCNATNI